MFEFRNFNRNLNLHILVFAGTVVVVVEEAIGVCRLDHLNQDGGELALQSQEALGESGRCHLKPN